MRISARLQPIDFEGPFAQWRRFAEQRIERAALIATDRATRSMLSKIRGDMVGAGLGRLGNALTSTSDMRAGRGVHRYTNGGFSASGIVYARSRSERTLGALEAYTQGAYIRPVRSRWLWIPTDAMQRVVGKGKDKQRLAPGNWRQLGMESKIGPLIYLKSVNGWPLAAVENVGVDLSGRRGSTKSLTKSGRARKGQIKKQIVIMFVAIPSTARAARVDVNAIARSAAAELPALFEQALGRI